MSVAAVIGRRAVRVANSLIDIFVLTVILLLLVFGCYAIWDSGQVHSAASSGRYEKFKPTIENEALSFKDLQAINPDIFAWLTVYGTNIDYPVAQGEDNIRYVNTSAEGRHSLSGAIFLDYRCDPSFSDFSSLFYGHHMDNATMFGEIERFYDKSYFNARRYGMLYHDGQERGLEFFAFVHADAYDNSIFRVRVGEDEQQAYLDTLIQAALHIRDDVSVTTDDRIVLLSTCSQTSTNGRDILIGKITETVHDNPFEVESGNNRLPIPTIDEIPGLQGLVSQLVKFIAIVLPCFLMLLVSAVTYKKLRKRQKGTTNSKGDE